MIKPDQNRRPPLGLKVTVFHLWRAVKPHLAEFRLLNFKKLKTSEKRKNRSKD
jgi:hypothetical protein